MDYIENYTYKQEGGGSGGIPLHIYGTEYLGGGSKNSTFPGSIYFPGGLFVNSFLYSREENEEKDLDHTTKNIYENYDTFLDLVSSSSSSSSSSSKKHRNSKKKIIFKKPNPKYSRKRKT